jgi:hypothetical protein
MSYYHTTHLENLSEIQQEVLSKIPDNELGKSSLFYLKDHYNLFLTNTLLGTTLAKMNMLEHVSGVGLIVVMPKSGIPIHCDSGSYRHSLNIPIQGYNQTYVSFYESLEEPNMVRVDKPNDSHQNGHGYLHYDIDKCKLINRFESIRPYIMDTQVPHNVYNNSNSIRIALLVRLNHTINDCIHLFSNA